MWFIMAIFQIVLALIQIPFFPSVYSILACGFCLGLAATSIILGVLGQTLASVRRSPEGK